MDENAESAGLSRRDLLKRSAVVGGLVWMAPTVLASPAGATVVTCVPAQRFGIRHNAPGGACVALGTTATAGNCAALAGITAFQKGCCLEPGLITFVESNSGHTHTYTLAAGVGVMQAFGYCGTTCYQHEEPHNAVVSEEQDPVTGISTVIVTCATLTHSELIVCLSGSNLPVCP